MATEAELTEELTKLKTARDAILTGGVSEWSSDGTGVKRLDLAVLQRAIRDIEMRLTISQNSGALTYSNPGVGGIR